MQTLIRSNEKTKCSEETLGSDSSTFLHDLLYLENVDIMDPISSL